jgi:hypothetical protein
LFDAIAILLNQQFHIPAFTAGYQLPIPIFRVRASSHPLSAHP